MADSANGARDVGRSRACEQIMSRQDAKTQSAKNEESGVRIQEPGGRGSHDAPGGEPLWIVPRNPRDICLGACLTANFVKQAAPGNVSTRVRFVGPLSEGITSQQNDRQNIACRNSREPPV